jgi:hypothetical protein
VYSRVAVSQNHSPFALLAAALNGNVRISARSWAHSSTSKASDHGLRPLVLFDLLLITGSLMSSGVFAEDARPGATQIIASYRVYFAGFHFGDARLTMALRGTEYQMNGEGRFSVLGGLIADYRGTTTS